MPRLSVHRRLSAGILLILISSALTIPASAVEVPGLYEATVTMEQDTQAQRATAFRDAMVLVLVRVTGNPAVAADPQVADLVRQSESYVQQYRRTQERDLWVGFDGEDLGCCYRQRDKESARPRNVRRVCRIHA